MKILNYGSLNVDHVYQVPHIVRPGETLAGQRYQVFGGGKGANQSVALGRAGAGVWHAGKTGPEAAWLLGKLKDSGVDVAFVRLSANPAGHALIQVDGGGENAIVLFPGANREIARAEVDETLASFAAGDVLLLQNEISEIPYIMEQAHRKGMRICFNPAPFGAEVNDYGLDRVDILIANEIEGEGLTGRKEPGGIVDALAARLPRAALVLTLGAAGVLYRKGAETLSVPACRVARVVDTTAAGDTFVGYFLAHYVRDCAPRVCLEEACRAAALCVSRLGAMDSIPYREELARAKERAR